MRPLVVHTSSKATVPAPRRVIHIEYTDRLEHEGGLTICAEQALGVGAPLELAHGTSSEA
jgi:hypothetical protein